MGFGHFDTRDDDMEQKKYAFYNLIVTSKKRNHEFINTPIHEFKMMQMSFKAFKMKKQDLKCFLN